MQALFEQRLLQCEKHLDASDEEIKSKCIVFYDTETTGLDARHKDQVVELGAVCPRTRKSFERLVAIDPLQFPLYTGEFTGILPSMLKDAPPLAKVLTDFLQWIQAQCDEKSCKEVVLVAHNNHQFDMVLLERHFRECKISVSEVLRPRLTYADSLPALRHAVLAKVKSFALGSLLGLADVKLHRALADCQALVIVLFDERFDVNKLWGHMYEKRKESSSSVSRIQRR